MLRSKSEIIDVVAGLGFYCEIKVPENSDISVDVLMVTFRGEEFVSEFIVDGIPKGHNYYSINAEYRPSVMKNMYIAAGNEARLVYNSGIVIYIETDEQKYRDLLYEKKVRNAKTIDGLQIVKEVYNPQYRTEEERNFPMPDTRKTIHWDPEVAIDENGKAAITFFNSDRLTRIKCILEGITGSGIPVYGEAFYDVTTYRE